MIGYVARDVVERFGMQLLIVHFGQLMYAVIQVPGALATMLPVPTFANAVADAVASGVGGGAVGAGEGMCDLGSFVVRDDERLWSESALEVDTLACALQWKERRQRIHCCSV